MSRERSKSMWNLHLETTNKKDGFKSNFQSIAASYV